MEDLSYIVTLGFSGSDVGRAVLIAFLLGMFVNSKRPVFMLTVIGFLIDQVIWPIAGQATSGAEAQTVAASFGAMMSSLPQNLGVYAVRFVGLFVLIAAFAFTRSSLHGLFGGKAKAKPA